MVHHVEHLVPAVTILLHDLHVGVGPTLAGTEHEGAALPGEWR